MTMPNKYTYLTHIKNNLVICLRVTNRSTKYVLESKTEVPASLLTLQGIEKCFPGLPRANIHGAHGYSYTQLSKGIA